MTALFGFGYLRRKVAASLGEAKHAAGRAKQFGVTVRGRGDEALQALPAATDVVVRWPKPVKATNTQRKVARRSAVFGGLFLVLLAADAVWLASVGQYFQALGVAFLMLVVLLGTAWFWRLGFGRKG